MDIEFSSPAMPSHPIFKGIEQFPISELYQQQVTLENSFLASPQHQQSSILLTLINNTLLISDPNAVQVQPHAAVNFSFDLKFEVIYQTHVTL